MVLYEIFPVKEDYPQFCSKLVRPQPKCTSTPSLPWKKYQMLNFHLFSFQSSANGMKLSEKVLFEIIPHIKPIRKCHSVNSSPAYAVLFGSTNENPGNFKVRHKYHFFPNLGFQRIHNFISKSTIEANFQFRTLTPCVTYLKMAFTETFGAKMTIS